MIDKAQVNNPIPAYKGTVFLSYARADDIKPPFEETVQGWVKFFWEQLRWELTERGVHQAELWLDRYQIEPTEDFTQKIEAALQEARMIIPVLSPNWVQREWCRKEVDRFVQLHAVDDIVPVIKIEAPAADLPAPLKNREGYTFYAKDATGAVHEFYWRGLKDKDAYFEVIKRIATWIASRLINYSASSKKKAVAAEVGQVVYLATAADELRDARQRVANDLEGAGYVVYPPDGLPDTKAKAEAQIREQLAKSSFSVHFIGDSDGVKPEESDEGIVRLQLRIAREYSGASGSLPRLLWVPKWLPGNRDKKRDPFEVLKRFGSLLAGEEVYAEEATDLSQMLRSRLTKPPAAGRIVPHLLVTAAAAEDDGLVGVLANRLQSDEIKVKLRFPDDAEPLGNLDQMAGVLLLWDKASPASINAQLDALLAGNAKVTVLWLASGDVAAKQRFFRDGVYVDQLAEIPSDRKTARELLVRLEIAPPGVAPNAKQLS